MACLVRQAAAGQSLPDPGSYGSALNIVCFQGIHQQA
jgi:hypothetical protein